MTCNTLGACLTCDATKNRVMDPVTNLCVCMTQFDESNSNELCFPCFYWCDGCTGSNPNQCKKCLNPSERTLLATKSCPCNSNSFYDLPPAPDCLDCHYSCKKCTNSASSTQCDSCDALVDFRTFDAMNQYCLCLP